MKKATDIGSGNISEFKAKRGWIFGNFPENPLPYPFNIEDFEVKLTTLEKGQVKEEAKGDSTRMTVTILLEGQHEVSFPETGQTVTLKKEGDYAFFGPNVLHTWRALTNNKTITFRWLQK